MIGNKTLAVPGPTNMPSRISQSMAIPLEDHRAPDFPDFIMPLLDDLKKVFRTETGRVLVFPGSGTGGWEAALRNTLSAGDGDFTEMCRQIWLSKQELANPQVSD